MRSSETTNVHFIVAARLSVTPRRESSSGALETTSAPLEDSRRGGTASAHVLCTFSSVNPLTHRVISCTSTIGLPSANIVTSAIANGSGP